MRVTSTVDEYLALALLSDPESRRQAWKRDYETAHGDVFDVYYRSWSSPGLRGRGADDVPLIAPDVRRLEKRAISLARWTEREFRHRGLLTELDLVLMVGNHTSNGWVAELDGRQSLFLALEFLGDPPFDSLLVSHEALHVAHLRSGAADWPEDVGTSLIQEGLATAVSRELRLGLSESSYLWFDDHHDSWVKNCAESERAIATVVLEDLATSADVPRVKGLFAANSQTGALPSRSGYWLGDRLAQRWLSQHAIQDVLLWDHSEAVHRAEQELRLLSA